MNAYLPPSARRGFRIAALIATVVCVLAIAAGAFVVSYTGVRDMALTAGVAAHYARFYPWIFDAVFVVAAVAALSLRGALRAYAWVAILVILGAVATADAIHAMSIVLPKRLTEATVAAAPWAVLLIGFTLLYAMARQALLPTRRAAAVATSTSNGRPENGGQATQVPLSALLADSPKTEPVTTKTELIAPEMESIAAKTDPRTTKTQPTAPKTEPVPRTESLSTKPTTAEPVTTEYVSVVRTKPVTAEPVTSEPVTVTRTEPLATKPVTVAGAGPVSAEPTSTEPASTELVSGEIEPDPPAAPTVPEPVASPANPYPARTQQFAVRRPPTTARPFTEPELQARLPAERDDPSDADAEPVEPTMHFNRLRSGPTPPDED